VAGIGSLIGGGVMYVNDTGGCTSLQLSAVLEMCDEYGAGVRLGSSGVLAREELHFRMQIHHTFCSICLFLYVAVAVSGLIRTLVSIRSSGCLQADPHAHFLPLQQ